MSAVRSQASVLRWIVLGLTAGAIYVCWPLWPALVLAAWTSALARPLLRRFERGLKGRRRAAAVLSLLLFIVFLLPLALITIAAITGAQDLSVAIAQASTAKGALEAIATGSVVAPLQVPRSLEEVIELLRQYGEQGLSLLTKVAGAAASGLIALFIYFGGAFVFLVDGPAVWAWLEEHSPLDPDHLERFTAAFQETGRGLLVGVGLTAAAQGLVATILYASLGVPRWWVLGPITGMTSIIPLVGSAAVWAPIALGLFLTGHPIKGTILVVLGVGVVGTVDNLLRPIFARYGALKMRMYLLFVSIFGGLAVFGAWGALLGPLVVRLWMEALALDREASGSRPDPGTEASASLKG